ncbi:hypothetical protein [Sutterella megalosphaeroides]|uniref:Uncharacterized protein n=1 Tax=Sutterella megalosphaeroides TaxID=2494234 RepID=A0A2Z6ID59_9BURK|nr:hypothetical protein [Sutterella megalosphaeroides]BBF23038.1 hypothetical protein SUTMEG_09290 [Sutterella megalosphaeroides]
MDVRDVFPSGVYRGKTFADLCATTSGLQYLERWVEERDKTPAARAFEDAARIALSGSGNRSVETLWFVLDATAELSRTRFGTERRGEIRAALLSARTAIAHAGAVEGSALAVLGGSGGESGDFYVLAAKKSMRKLCAIVSEAVRSRQIETHRLAADRVTILARLADWEIPEKRPEGLRALLAAFDRLLDIETADDVPTVTDLPAGPGPLATAKAAKATNTTKATNVTGASKTSERPEPVSKTASLFEAVQPSEAVSKAGFEASPATEDSETLETESPEFPRSRENRETWKETVLETGKAPARAAISTGTHTSARKTSAPTVKDATETRPLRSWEIWGGW